METTKTSPSISEIIEITNPAIANPLGSLKTPIKENKKPKKPKRNRNGVNNPINPKTKPYFKIRISTI